jgi:hypothetical protein
MRHNPDRGIMDGLMGARGVVAFGIAEGFEGRQVDTVLRDDIAGPVAAMMGLGSCGGKEGFRPFDPLHQVGTRHGLGVEVIRQAVDLLDVKDGVALEERDFG